MSDSGAGAAPTILIIDDNPDMAFAVSMPLEAAGYQVAWAQSGREGLDKVLEIAPDLLILDVMMETSTAGFQVSLTCAQPRSELAIRSIPRHTHPDADRDPHDHVAALRPGRDLSARR